MLFRNLGATINTPPQVPTNLNAIASTDGVQFLWRWSSDDQTPWKALQYNLRVGSRPGAEDFVSPLADVSGFRRVVQVGNGSSVPGRWVTGLTNAGAYFWSVQAIDGAFAGSVFAPEQMLLIGPPHIDTFSLQTNGTFCLEFYALAGSSHTVLVSSNLVEWSVAGPAQEVSTNRFRFCEPTAWSVGVRFYKISSL